MIEQGGDDREKIRAHAQAMADAGRPQAEIEAFVKEAMGALSPEKPRLGAVPKAVSESTQQGFAPVRDPNEAKASELDPDNSTYAGRFAATLLKAPQVIPGIKAYEALAGAIGNKIADPSQPFSYENSLNTLEEQTGKMGKLREFASQAVAGPVIAPFLPANPITAGALVGGAGQALEAEGLNHPTVGLGKRALRTAAGAAIGAGAGAVANQLTAGGQALASRATGSSAKILAGAKEAREKMASPLYQAAEREMGAGGVPTQDVQAFLARPDVQQIVKGLQDYDEFQGVAPDSYKMMDAVRKVLSDRSGKEARAAAMANPASPNLGRFETRQLGATKDAFKQATDPLMPSYQKGLDAYAAGSKNVEAVRRAQDAFKALLSKSPPTGRNLDRTTPEAFTEFMQQSSPEARTLANKTIGAASRGTGVLGRQAASRLSRATGASSARAIDMLVKLGLLSANAARP